MENTKTVIVKAWWYRNEQTKAGSYDWTLVWSPVFDEEKDPMHEKAVAYILQGEEVRETEKAKNFTLDFWNLRKAGRYVTDAPMERRWKTWIPKSVILNRKVRCTKFCGINREYALVAE